MEDQSDELCERFWAERLIAGIGTWAEVPEEHRKGVTEELAVRVVMGEIEEGKMNAIIFGV